MNGWKFHKKADGMIQIQNPPTSIILKPIPLDEQKIAQNLADEFFTGIMTGAQLEDIVQSPIQEVTISHGKGFESTFSGSSKSMKMRAVIVQGNQKAFVLALGSTPEMFNERSGDFEQILQNIKF